MRTDETYNLFNGDWLRCMGCDALIFGIGINDKAVRVSEINQKYQSHIKKCFPIKRLVVKTKQYHGIT